MADPTAIVPYHDPYDCINTIEHILMSDEYPELPSFPEPNFTNCSIPQFGNDEIADANDPLADPFIWEVFNNQRVDNSEAGTSGIHSETNGQNTQQQHCNPQNPNCGNPFRLSVWPVPAVPYTCTCCQVLREITHINGIHITKLEIHGRVGIICHAILEKYESDLTSQNHEYQMFDFCKESITSVKQFLIQYCKERLLTGYTMLQDPLLIFYEALCVGLNWDDNLDIDDFIQPSPTNSGELQMNQPEAMNQPEIVNQPEAESAAVNLTRSSLAAQRERTGKLTLKDFIQYVRLPIECAAKKMNICPTVVKKICRKHGLPRWPYRKIKSLEGKIAGLERKIAEKRESLTADDAEERVRAQVDIESFQQELAYIFSRFSG